MWLRVLSQLKMQFITAAGYRIVHAQGASNIIR